MSEQTDQQIKERLAAIFPDKQVQARVIDVVTSKRPPGWGRKSYAPYFKEHHAKWIKEFVDIMIKEREAGKVRSMVFLYSVFCTPEEQKSEQTLYLQVLQSTNFLMEYMDPDNKYKQWRQMIILHRDKDRGGVCMDWDPRVVNIREPLKPVMVEPPQMKPLWQREIDRYLESDETKPFVKDSLALTPAQVAEVKQSLCQLSNIIFDVTSSAIKIIKVNNG